MSNLTNSPAQSDATITGLERYEALKRKPVEIVVSNHSITTSFLQDIAMQSDRILANGAKGVASNRFPLDRLRLIEDLILEAHKNAQVKLIKLSKLTRNTSRVELPAGRGMEVICSHYITQLITRNTVKRVANILIRLNDGLMRRNFTNSRVDAVEAELKVILKDFKGALNEVKKLSRNQDTKSPKARKISEMVDTAEKQPNKKTILKAKKTDSHPVKNESPAKDETPEAIAEVKADVTDKKLKKGEDTSSVKNSSKAA